MFPRIAFACLAALSFAIPAQARLGVGPSAPIDPVKFPAVRNQDQVAAADNGTVSLFVWRDTRHGDADVFGARIGHDGRILDPNGIELASGAGSQSEPAVSWDGTQWLVAWNDEGTIKAQRVSTAGAILDPAPIELSGSLASHPGLAWNGTVHIAVWSESVSNVVQVYGATLDGSGNILVAGAPLSLGASDVQPVIAAAGANALVAFKTSRAGNEDVYAFRVSATLAALTRVDAADVALVSQTDPQESPAVASDGTSWLVAWQDLRSRVTNADDIRGTRVSSAGAVQDAGSIAIAVGPGADRNVALTHNGSSWLASWTSATGGQLLHAIANNGNPTGSTQVVSNSVPMVGDGCFGGAAAQPLVVWSEPSGDESNLLSRLTGNVLGSPALLATQTPNQTEPAQALGGNHWMITWVDDRFGAAERQVRFGLSDSARFEPPNPASIAFAVPRPGIDQGHPAIAFDGTNFNLVWDENRGGHKIVVGARFTPGGAMLDTFTVAGDSWNQYEPDIVADTSGSVSIVWTDSRVGALERDVWIAQYKNGVDVGGRKAMAQVAGQREEHPAVTIIQGDLVLVAYETSGPSEDRGIEAAYIHLPIVSSSPGHDIVDKQAGHTYEHPTIANNGEDGLIAFQEVVFSDGPALHIPRASQWSGDNVFARFAFQIAPGSYTPANPVIGSAGYDYVGLWGTRLTGDIDVRAAAIEPDGEALDSIYALTNDPVVDTPGSAEQGLVDRVGFTYMRARTDSLWTGLQLYGGDSRDTLSGEVLINEFLAHPSSGVSEFLELFNRSGRSFLLNGWTLRVNGVPNTVEDCSSFLRTPPPNQTNSVDRKARPEGTPCSFIGSGDYFSDQSFFLWTTPDPVEGHLPDRGATLELFTPGGVLVDRVGYGFKGGAPVSGAIPNAIAPAAATPPVASRYGVASLDSTDLSTARIPNGVDTGNDANDWNLTSNTTANSPNTGTAAQLGTTLFVGRAYWNPSTGQPTVELFNPSTSTQFDFSGWYISNNVSTEKIGVNTNGFSLMKPLDTRELRRGERGSFTFGMDQFSVLYLFGPDLTRYEQLGWSRADQLAPDKCATRLSGTGGTHDGFDWLTCGGQENVNSGELQYTTCNISSPTTDVPAPGISVLSFAGSFPNPSHGPAVLVFSVPGITGGQPVRARLSLYDVAGRRVATLVDGAFAPGTQRVPLQRVDEARRTIRAGTYYADLEVGGQRVRRTLVFLD